MYSDIRIVGMQLYFLPVNMRLPMKFGAETVDYVTCARACVKVVNADGKTAEGWGETPLSVTWGWPSRLSYHERHKEFKKLCVMLAQAWIEFKESGHPVELGYSFTKSILPRLLNKLNLQRTEKAEPMPWLAALICCSVFDIAIHDAYGNLLGLPVYKTYTRDFMNYDLSRYLIPAKESSFSFQGNYPTDFLIQEPPLRIFAWHLVGGKDLIDEPELTAAEPDDGYPALLGDWIKRDGLKCLKIKLTGTDSDWDYDRLVRVGEIALENGVLWLTADFNCLVQDPAYVNDILDRLMAEHPRIYQMILYVEQPFPYELKQNQIDVHSVSARKPLFMDESAHDWQMVRLGRSLGWTGVALKTCKTQTGALLTMCWAKAHGMPLMVQDLTNPMLAQIPHVLLAAHAGTIMGVETNSMQFCPEASKPEEAVHPGIYRRRKGLLDLSTVSGPGFGYRHSEIERELPEVAASFWNSQITGL